MGRLGLGEDERQGRDILTYELPSVDVFKAIFASDDDEDEAEAEVTNVIVDERMAKTMAEERDEPVDPETFKPSSLSPKRSKSKSGNKRESKEKG